MCAAASAKFILRFLLARRKYDGHRYARNAYHAFSAAPATRRCREMTTPPLALRADAMMLTPLHFCRFRCAEAAMHVTASLIRFARCAAVGATLGFNFRRATLAFHSAGQLLTFAHAHQHSAATLRCGEAMPSAAPVPPAPCHHAPAPPSPPHLFCHFDFFRGDSSIGRYNTILQYRYAITTFILYILFLSLAEQRCHYYVKHTGS